MSLDGNHSHSNVDGPSRPVPDTSRDGADVPSGSTLSDLARFDAQGLIPAVIQHVRTRQVLMVGYMNRESLEVTLRERKACFWSRSRGRLWRKGETSGHFLKVEEIRIDCDGDALVLLCEPAGPTCHTNETSCFYRKVEFDGTVRPDGDSAAEAGGASGKRSAT